ncbi:MAG TPA: anaerobic ribonucleoside-triphosphate reductase activating protein, partial [Bacillota bacterium]|nr:anaerobic ribonucleoside-triphosphate reductase activating protein [Bacillota bacterium]
KSSLIDYPGKASTVFFLGGCNFRCGYCHNSELVQGYGNEIDPEELFDFLKKRKRFLDGVCISGGEPTLHKELPEFVKEIKELGLAVKLDTNGTEPDMLRDLIEKGLVDYVAMDIKGPAYKYEQIARSPVNLGNIKESAKLLTDARSREGFSCEFRTTVCRELLSAEDIERMIAEYPEAPPWYLQRFYNPGNILDNEGIYSAYSSEEMEELGRRLCVNVR